MSTLNKARFFDKVDTAQGPDACHTWTGAKIGPYGAFNIHAFGEQYAHRIAYSLAYGGIPRKLCVCHKCDNPVCCNPTHLFLGTQQDNVTDKIVKGRQARGARNAKAKLTDELAMDIFNSKRLVRETAAIFNVSYGLVVEIRAKKIWKHIHKGDCNGLGA